MKESITNRLEGFRHWYCAYEVVKYVVHLPLEDDDSETWHPFYEILRRSIAVAAMREALNNHVIEVAGAYPHLRLY